MQSLPSQEQLDALLEFDTCTIANAIEVFDVRLRNEGYTGPGLCCCSCESPRILGYAVTSRIKTSNPPPVGYSYYDRTDWWTVLQSCATPALAVVQDVDASPGKGAVVGEVHASILRALNCVGLITNGSVRDLPGLKRLGFTTLSASLAVSHSYAHMVDFGEPVKIFGLTVTPGDLLYGDRHGVLSIPISIVADIPHVARYLAAQERTVIDLCQSPNFSLKELRQRVKGLE
jgi:regulator of RNase E activity RraA